MTLKCGIVGLPNVGKSTLFNALVGSSIAQAANYPFCTIEPNNGIIAVPDERLNNLANIASSAKIIPTQLEFVDIAGLVKGASQGEGLGNKFLGHIREVDAIAYVLRCFEDDDVIHVYGKVNPLQDAEVIKMELLLADLDSLRSRLPSLEKKAKISPEANDILKISIDIISCIENGKLSPRSLITKDNDKMIKNMQLLSTKPFFYICNVGESEINTGNNYSDLIKFKEEDIESVLVSAKIESEIASINDFNERLSFINEMGMNSSGLDRIAQCAYKILDLQMFFTIGPKEARAWTIKRGFFAPQAAGIIHSDFEKGFICAETISYNDYIHYKGENGAKDAGKMRIEGKQYIVQDGDIIHFRFNV
ncbi:redox-regulated ATPase YchF [Lyticum sinuosum]|uniref:Ribosome-binding ATPase YchF n=1 Tax=Lyticum sinuosum TaxID=1332059 RepID=A0AAE4VKL7_9RICK|nr:redox-regulated ATPase YchF [Lyticum sinuosum]MDZ5760979.1 Redox-regulated ATPase YchF [Lyticum sinuosum]